MVLWLLVEQFMPLEELVSKRLNAVLTTFVQLFRIPALSDLYKMYMHTSLAYSRCLHNLSYHYWHTYLVCWTRKFYQPVVPSGSVSEVYFCSYYI
jgi:hypothetical protein